METADPKKVKLIKKVSKILSVFYHTKKATDKINFEDAKEVLIFDPSLIGDTIMNIPFLKVVKSNFKNAKITYLCAKHGETILKDTGLVDRFIICNGVQSFISVKNILKDFKHLKNVLKEVNKINYDVAIEARGDFRYIYYMHFMKAKRKISFNYSGGECFLTDVIDMPENYKTTHVTDDKIYLMKQIGAKIQENELTPDLPITNEMKLMKEKFIKENNLEDYKLIGIHPGAREKIRRFEKFDELLKNINEKNKDVAFIVYEGVNEEEAVNKVINTAKECGARVVRSKSNLAEYIKMITYADAMICNDSSAAHISNAYRIPTTVIYGPVNPEGIRPYNNKTAILNCISIPLECKPCYKTETCPKGTYDCFNKINVEELTDVVLKSIQ